MMDERIQKLKTMLEKTPDDCFLNHALALEYIKRGDETGAQQQFEKNLSHDPAYVATYYHYAKLLVAMGEEEKSYCYIRGGYAVCQGCGRYALI